MLLSEESHIHDHTMQNSIDIKKTCPMSLLKTNRQTAVIGAEKANNAASFISINFNLFTILSWRLSVIIF